MVMRLAEILVPGDSVRLSGIDWVTVKSAARLNSHDVRITTEPPTGILRFSKGDYVEVKI